VHTQYRSLNRELTVTMPPQPVLLDADPVRLAQVIGNLLNNACKFTDRGGHVRLTVEQVEGRAVLRVQDDGIGIASDQLPGIFEMFAQVDTSLERSRDGLGIGLTLVKTLVEMHGGTVEARSDGLGLGSEFVVRLPLAAGAPEARPPAGAPAPPVSRRVLIVDDNEDGAESLAMLLELGGHVTRKAYDGVEAIEAAERWRPDAVLLDIGLPKVNGYEACRRIREHPWGKDILLVALTGWGQEEDRHRSEAAGFDAHIVKPADPAVLMRLLTSLPSGHLSRQDQAG
jgi:CheY-like chemotaxis protein